MDYKQTTIAGKAWQRCLRVIAENPYQQMPTIQFIEERRIAVSETETLAQAVGGIYDAFDQPAQTFPLLNPETGAATGATMTDAEFYAVLYSRYMFAAEKRDAKAVPAVGGANGTPV